MKLKTLLWFVLRWLIWIKDNIFDCPEIDENLVKKYEKSIWKTVLWQDILSYAFWHWSEKILYFGWTHWNEVWTVKLMNRWVNFLAKQGDDFFCKKEIIVIPCLNIDWYWEALKRSEYFSWGRFGKVNSNKVDLNRNFPTANWSKKSTLFAAWKHSEVSGWESAWSESETMALLDLIEWNKVKTVYTFHNCWGTVFGKWTQLVHKKVRDYSQKSWYRVFQDEEFDSLEKRQKTGQIMVWAEEKKIDVIEVEMRTRWWSEWKANKEALLSSLQL